MTRCSKTRTSGTAGGGPGATGAYRSSCTTVAGCVGLGRTRRRLSEQPGRWAVDPASRYCAGDRGEKCSPIGLGESLAWCQRLIERAEIREPTGASLPLRRCRGGRTQSGTRVAGASTPSRPRVADDVGDVDAGMRQSRVGIRLVYSADRPIEGLITVVGVCPRGGRCIRYRCPKSYREHWRWISELVTKDVQTGLVRMVCHEYSSRARQAKQAAAGRSRATKVYERTEASLLGLCDEVGRGPGRGAM